MNPMSRLDSGSHDTDAREDREWPGSLLPPEDVPEDAPVVDLTDEANAEWLDECGPSSTPFTELSESEREEFDELLEKRLEETD
jgi:hypothetical protein